MVGSCVVAFARASLVAGVPESRTRFALVQYRLEGCEQRQKRDEIPTRFAQKMISFEPSATKLPTSCTPPPAGAQ